MALADLNKVLYVDADFDTAVSNIQAFLNAEFPDEYNDYVDANTGQALIDIIAYSEQNLMWYLNRKVNDLYMSTAVTPSAVSKWARQLGYKPKSATAAEVQITMKLTKGPYNFPVPVNPGQKFNGPNNSIWEYRGDVPIVYAPGETVKTFTLGQGQTVTSTFVSNNQDNQIFKLRAVPTGKYIAGEGLAVTVNGVEWTEAPIIPFDTVQQYETNLLSNPPYVKFGDGVQGQIPPLGAGISVTYVITDGFRGRILSGGITGPVGSLVAQFQSIPVSISQPSSSAGGDDPEDIRSIVVNAPLFQFSQNRAITKIDYDFQANQYPNVAMADAEIIRSVSGDLTVQALFGIFREQIADLETCSGFTLGTSSAVSSLAASVSGYLDVLYEHIDETFNDSCQANLVQVAVLAKDANRRYISPLQSTLDGLKAHLNSIKEVTHTVAVVDGTANVINATVVIDVKVNQNANEDNVVKAISDALSKSDVAPFGLLVDRAANVPLYVWNIETRISDDVVPRSQIDYINVRITGPAQYLDNRGNLIPPTGYVIQDGGVTINRLPRY